MAGHTIEQIKQAAIKYYAERRCIKDLSQIRIVAVYDDDADYSVDVEIVDEEGRELPTALGEQPPFFSKGTLEPHFVDLMEMFKKWDAGKRIA